MGSHPSVYGWMPTSELGGAAGEKGGTSGGNGGSRGGGGTPGGGEGGCATWMLASRSEGARPTSAATAAPMEAADVAKLDWSLPRAVSVAASSTDSSVGHAASRLAPG